MSDNRVCRLCSWWKRRTAVSGTCWLRAEVYPSPQASTAPEFTCDSWQPKTVPVVRTGGS
jgi:hypothetical protein